MSINWTLNDPRLLRATINLVLALAGEPEPAGDTTLPDLTLRLDSLAARIRQEGVEGTA